jgi:hypothetical protein
VKELLAIHSAENYPPDAAALAGAERQPIPDLPGHIVAVAIIGHWQRVRPNRCSFRLENVRKLDTPIPAKGELGIWTIEIDTEKQIWDELGEPMPKVRS